MRDALAALIGEKNVRSDAEARTGASSGWHPASAKQRQSSDGGAAAAPLPALVVSPGDASEVAAVVRWANETRTPLIPVGGASNTTGSTVPEPRRGVAVRLDRLQSLDWDEESLVVRAGAGWNLGALEERLNAHGYTLGHAPQSLHLATVGGCVATNAVGVLSGKYGRQSDLTLAVEAVLPNGEIVRLGGPPAGPDLLGLLIGSEGTLGIVTEATLRMSPLPDVRAWAAFTFERFATGWTPSG
jgi:alkyldihydroxyacetonephosphate synthase